MFEHLRDFCVWPQPLVIQKISKFICVLCLLIEYTLLLWHSRQKNAEPAGETGKSICNLHLFMKLLGFFASCSRQ